MERSTLPSDAPSNAGLRGSEKILWLALAGSLLLSLTPWGYLVLYPFKLFTTWVHECGHALMAVLLGGSVDSITIATDTSGLTRSRYPAGVISSALVSSSGYMGASVFGCALMAATRLPRLARPILVALGFFMLLSMVLWMRNLFGAAVVAVLGASFMLLARNSRGRAAYLLLNFLAVQVALNALFDIRVLFLVTGGVGNDAESMERLLLLPSWLWAGLWMLSSVGLLVGTLWLTRLKGVGAGQAARPA